VFSPIGENASVENNLYSQSDPSDRGFKLFSKTKLF